MNDDSRIFRVACANDDAKANLQRTVKEGVPEEVYSELTDIDDLSGTVPIWGVPNRTSTWDDLSPGDFLLFYTGQDTDGVRKYTHCGRVQAKETNKDLQEALWEVYTRDWGDGQSDDPWENIIYFSETFEIELPSAKLHGYDGIEKEYIQNSFISFGTNEDAHSKIRSEYGSISEFIDAHRVQQGLDHWTAETEDEPVDVSVWIEKSYHDREDRDVDGWGLGDALWCPQTRTNEGSSIHYEMMKQIDENDVILHLDQGSRAITAISRAADEYSETTCLPGTRWDQDGVEKMGYEEGERPAYKVPLQSFQPLDEPLSVNDFLNESNRESLDRIRDDHTVVYSKKLNLNQGAYLTMAPEELVQLMNRAYDDLSNQSLSYLSHVGNGETSSTEGTSGHLAPDAIVEALLEGEVREDIYRDLYEESLAHLVAGKNIVYYGPPGTGKTRAAQRLSSHVCENVSLVTGNSEWTNYQVSGGYAPGNTESGWESQPGFLAEAVEDCTNSLEQNRRPSWLIIDELNRANLDEAFGEVFTLLDLEYRTEQPIEYGDESVYMPLSFRILATMNTYDKAQLFSLGYAFRRRFAFVDVPSLLVTEDSTEPSAPRGNPFQAEDYPPALEQTKPVIESAAIENMLRSEGQMVKNDSVTVFQTSDNRETIEEAFDKLLTDDELSAGSTDVLDVLLLFSNAATSRDIVEVGQALLIDAVKFILAYDVMFDAGWSTVDRAIISYLVPQFEHFMPELRRAETINQDSDAPERFDELIQLTDDLNLPATTAALEEAKETKRVLE